VSGKDLTRDAFLGGRLHVWQPKKDIAPGPIPVFLAAACPARSGEQRS
jgi:tRNA1Val (adenine37-N6)-methyltransferase